MLDSKLLHTLATVIECKGFEKAASQLGVTQSAVSQRIKQLEDHIGQPLLLRSQPLEATPAGKRLLQHFCQLSLLEEELMAHIKPDSAGPLHSKLSLACEPDSLATWLLPALAPLMQQHQWQLNISALPDDGNLLGMDSRLCGWVSQDGRSLHGSQPMLLGSLPYACVCSHAFHHQHLAGTSEVNFGQLQAVVLNHQQSRHQSYLQQFAGFDGAFPCVSVPTPEAMLQMIDAGLAYGLLPQEYLSQRTADGALYYLPGSMQAPLYWHHWRIEPAPARQLGAALLAARQVRNASAVLAI